MNHISAYLKQIEMGGKTRYVAASAPPSMNYCKPDCPICHGSIWVRQDVPVGHPDFGKLKPCPNADLYAIHGEKQLGVTRKELDASWSSIVYREDANTNEAVQAILDTLQNGQGWIFFHGGYGLAKTLLLKIVVAEMLRKGKLSAYARMAEVIENLRQAYSDKDNAQEEAGRRLDFWTTLPVLCLDEFDRLRPTEFADEKKFVLLDRRYEDAIREKSVTILASNAHPNTFDGYLASRINDKRFKVIELTGKDFRQS
jgi:DNA replication protein DnaC